MILPPESLQLLDPELAFAFFTLAIAATAALCVLIYATI